MAPAMLLLMKNGFLAVTLLARSPACHPYGDASYLLHNSLVLRALWETWVLYPFQPKGFQTTFPTSQDSALLVRL